jgi:hypothetical protein
MTETGYKINPELLEISKTIFSALSEQRPEQSFSFTLTQEGVEAIADVGKVVEWGIGGNKSKLKETAQEAIAEFERHSIGEPVNVNFTEYELKAMAEVVAAVEKAIDSHEDGVLV